MGGSGAAPDGFAVGEKDFSGGETAEVVLKITVIINLVVDAEEAQAFILGLDDFADEFREEGSPFEGLAVTPAVELLPDPNGWGVKERGDLILRVETIFEVFAELCEGLVQSSKFHCRCAR